MTPECAAEILKIGPCQPGKRGKFNFPVADDDRSFCSAWYTDGKYDRGWLVYSPLKNKLNAQRIVLLAGCFPVKSCSLFVATGQCQS